MKASHICPSGIVLSAVCGLFLAGCGAREPFPMASVSGQVTYEDGSLIPVDLLCLRFVPQCGPVDTKTYPLPGMAVVDRATGTFASATTHKFHDGLIRGRHKVTLATLDIKPLPPSVIPAEYLDPTKTPLEVDTARLPFDLRVRKPKP